MRRSITSGRPGMTLVEMTVALCIAVLVMAAAWMVLLLARRSTGPTAEAESIRTAMLVEETIQADLRRLWVVGPCPVRFWPDRPSRLAFYAIDPAEPPALDLPVRAVRYSHDARERDGLLIREWNAREAPVGGLPLKSIAFLPYHSDTGPLLRVTLSIARGRGDAPGDPLEHTFLCRINAPVRAEDLEVRILSGFLDPADGPIDQFLPEP